MRILAIDCATSACSAAVGTPDGIVARRYREMVRGHAEALMPMIREVLDEAGWTVWQLDLLAATVGPGAFTGVRIGLAAAQSMALAARLPLVGVTTLEAVAAAQPAPAYPLLVALDSKRPDLYFQLFAAAGQPRSDPAAALPREIPGLLRDVPAMVAGDARERAGAALAAGGLTAVLSDGPVYPDAAVVAGLAAARAAAGDIRPARPLYLRPPDVGPPRKALV